MLIFKRFSNLKSLLKLIMHVGLLCLSSYSGFWLRFDGDIPDSAMEIFLHTLPVLVVVRLVMFLPFRLYGTVWQYTSLWDLRNIVGATLSGTLVFYLVVSYGFGLAARRAFRYGSRKGRCERASSARAP